MKNNPKVVTRRMRREDKQTGKELRGEKKRFTQEYSAVQMKFLTDLVLASYLAYAKLVKSFQWL